ncbi:MAG: hypothetical protein WCO55_01205 [Candidatus Falkowbacteria bacterium]
MYLLLVGGTILLYSKFGSDCSGQSGLGAGVPCILEAMAVWVVLFVIIMIFESMRAILEIRRLSALPRQESNEEPVTPLYSIFFYEKVSRLFIIIGFVYIYMRGFDIAPTVLLFFCWPWLLMLGVAIYQTYKPHAFFSRPGFVILSSLLTKLIGVLILLPVFFSVAYRSDYFFGLILIEVIAAIILYKKQRPTSLRFSLIDLIIVIVIIASGIPFHQLKFCYHNVCPKNIPFVNQRK